MSRDKVARTKCFIEATEGYVFLRMMTVSVCLFVYISYTIV